MLFRRIAGRARRHNWFAILLDFAVVVIGIFVALQVDNWNAARKDRIDEMEFLVRLHGDIERTEELNSRVRTRRLGRLQLLLDSADVIFDRTDRDTLDDEECFAVSGAHYYNINITNLPVLVELISTGRMGIIRDAELRAALLGMQQINSTLAFLVGVQIEGAVDLPSKYPQLIRLEAYQDDARDEVWTRTKCTASEMRENPAFLNDFSEDLDRYDAFVRDGLRPWSRQLEELHRFVDQFLGIRHAPDE